MHDNDYDCEKRLIKHLKVEEETEGQEVLNVSLERVIHSSTACSAKKENTIYWLIWYLILVVRSTCNTLYEKLQAQWVYNYPKY